MKTYRFKPAGVPKQAPASIREIGWVSPDGWVLMSAIDRVAFQETDLQFEQTDSTCNYMASTRVHGCVVSECCEPIEIEAENKEAAWYALTAMTRRLKPLGVFNQPILVAQYLYDIEEVVRCERCGAECDESGGDVHYCGARSFMDAVAADSANAMSEALDQEVFGDTQPVINFYPFTGESPADRLEPVYRGIRRALAKQREKSQESAVAKLPDYQRGPIIRCQGDEDGDV